MSTQTKLEQIEKKVTEALTLINEARALAEEVGVDFTVAITGDFTRDGTSDGGSSYEESEDWNDSGCTF